jgi:hypothetical protein
MLRTLSNIKFLTVMVFFLVLMVTVLLPVIEQVAAVVIPLQPETGESSSLPITGVIDSTLTAVFVGMPLVFLGGIILVSFVIAGGLRGTSR